MRSCPACASTRDPVPFVVQEMMFGLDEFFDYGTCPECRSVFILDVPDDLGEYYSTKYYSFDMDPQAAMGRPFVAQILRAAGRSSLLGHNGVAAIVRHLGRVARVRQVETTLALFESIRLAGLARGAQSRVLDVGSGSGALVYALSLLGLPEVTGVDPFNDEDRIFDTGARVLRRELSAMTGSYDLIMLHHSLEHVPDPHETMSQVRQLLAPAGGRVLVRMPTVSSAAYERYGASCDAARPASPPDRVLADGDAGAVHSDRPGGHRYP